LSDEEKATIQDALKEAQEWYEANSQATKEEYEEQQKKLEGVASPIISKAYGGQAPPPGGAGAEDTYENPEDL